MLAHAVLVAEGHCIMRHEFAPGEVIATTETHLFASGHVIAQPIGRSSNDD
jgi:hypothetical protein